MRKHKLRLHELQAKGSPFLVLLPAGTKIITQEQQQPKEYILSEAHVAILKQSGSYTPGRVTVCLRSDWIVQVPHTDVVEAFDLEDVMAQLLHTGVVTIEDFEKF